MRRGLVFIDSARFYAYHGVLAQERRVGAWFVVSVWMDCDIEGAVMRDELQGTVSYADAYLCVNEEMAKPSATLEHVAGRIADRLLQLTNVVGGRIRISKENPPMGAALQGAGVELEF